MTTGEPVIGEVGELVLTEPMPSMPIFFWDDEDGDRYRESYFAMYPGVWRHGDWIKILPDGGSVIYGRSDSTLNRGGVRMGTSDFYRVVEAFEEVADSLVVDTGQLGQEGRLLLYIQLAEGVALVRRARSAGSGRICGRHCRHGMCPDEIRAVPGIPRTLSGKKLEVPVRKILQGTPVEKAANPDAMANPEVLTALHRDRHRLTVTRCSGALLDDQPCAAARVSCIFHRKDQGVAPGRSSCPRVG